jgi:hypothetical protein
MNILAFQGGVGDWMKSCFTEEIIQDKLERSDRFIEESLELVQACGYSADRAHALVDYVFNRPVGEPFQETGGVIPFVMSTRRVNEKPRKGKTRRSQVRSAADS